MPVVEIYTQPWCPYCARAIKLFTNRGVPFTEVAAPPGTPERAAAVQRSGGRTSVPQIFIGGQPIGGCDDLFALDRSGKLDVLLAA